LEYTRRQPLQTGDTVFIRAGTLHALGPGLLVYEVQQDSDITYRVFDWNRPASAGRMLHIVETLAVLKTDASAEPIPPPPFEDGSLALLIACPYFTLRLMTTEHEAVTADPHGQTFHALTAIHGDVEIQGEGWSLPLAMFESAIIPASAGAYHVSASSLARVLLASVE
jgi:mannose-6-phosphate isomerase